MRVCVCVCVSVCVWVCVYLIYCPNYNICASVQTVIRIIGRSITDDASETQSSSIQATRQSTPPISTYHASHVLSASVYISLSNDASHVQRISSANIGCSFLGQWNCAGSARCRALAGRARAP